MDSQLILDMILSGATGIVYILGILLIVAIVTTFMRKRSK